MATVAALLDCSHKAPGDVTWTVEAASVDIETAAVGACGHSETICPECAPQWALDYTFIEPFPWEE